MPEPHIPFEGGQPLQVWLYEPSDGTLILIDTKGHLHCCQFNATILNVPLTEAQKEHAKHIVGPEDPDCRYCTQ